MFFSFVVFRIAVTSINVTRAHHLLQTNQQLIKLSLASFVLCVFFFGFLSTFVPSVCLSVLCLLCIKYTGPYPSICICLAQMIFISFVVFGVSIHIGIEKHYTLWYCAHMYVLCIIHYISRWYICGFCIHSFISTRYIH